MRAGSTLLIFLPHIMERKALLIMFAEDVGLGKLISQQVVHGRSSPAPNCYMSHYRCGIYDCSYAEL